MKKRLALILPLVWCVNFTNGQTVDCENIGFETGTTQGWTLTNGQVRNNGQQVVFQNETVGSLENGHMITSGGNDPKITVETIPMVAPGSKHSIRIGNVTRGSRFDRIKSSFLVTSENTLFQYKIAVVLQNANHEFYEKPGFTIKITDNTGGELPCSFYDVQVSASGVIDNFKTQGDIQYRNWTIGAMDLRNYIGQIITVEVTAHGCTHDGHFGYAYFDAQCIKSEITQASSCVSEDGSMILVAPAGFEKYTWNTGETTRSISVKPSLGQKYWVKLVPYSSLNASCELRLDHEVQLYKAENIVKKDICEGQSLAVGDTIYRTSGHFIRKIRQNSFCDSTVNLYLTVHPLSNYHQQIIICEGENFAIGDSIYNAPGKYVNHFLNSNGCDSTVFTDLTVIKIDFTIPDNMTITKGDSIQLLSTSGSGDTYLFEWTPPDGLSCTDCPAPWASPGKTSVYSLIVSDTEKQCHQKKAVRVSVKPCMIHVPSAFSPNDDRINDYLVPSAPDCINRIKEMTIYSRWGEVIYQQRNMVLSQPACGWDGRYRGQLVSPGVYVYKLEAELKNGTSASYTGMINLLR